MFDTSYKYLRRFYLNLSNTVYQLRVLHTETLVKNCDNCKILI